MVALELGVFVSIECVGEVDANLAGDLFEERFIHRRRRVNALRLADFRGQIPDDSGDFTAAVVTVFDTLQDFSLGGASAAGFHHHNTFIASGDGDVELRSFRFLVSGVGDHLPVEESDADSAEHMVKRDVRDSERLQPRR